MGDVPGAVPAPGFEELSARLTDVFAAGIDTPLGDGRFDALALDVFRYQATRNRVYGALLRAQGIDLAAVRCWDEIPPVPTTAFRSLPLTCFPPEEAEAVFLTSGTTAPGDRGTHHVRSLALYGAALRPNFAAHVLPEGARMPFIQLLPPPALVPESSLSHMMGECDAAFGAPGGGWFVDPEEGLRIDAVRGVLEDAQSAGRQVLVTGTAFSMVHLLDAAGADGWSVHLPEGSRVMETGGYKGRSRTLTRAELHGGIRDVLGVPTASIVNEYGMTEMLSQFYRSPLRSTDGDVHVGPPWVRTRVLDPVTLAEVESGPGILAHLDLANLGTVAAILTADVGERVGTGFRLHGRAAGAEPRGCSLAAEELMSVVRGGR